MADYQMLGELLGLPNVNVLGYQAHGARAHRSAASF
jgi:hypothetical protein